MCKKENKKKTLTFTRKEFNQEIRPSDCLPTGANTTKRKVKDFEMKDLITGYENQCVTSVVHVLVFSSTGLESEQLNGPKKATKINYERSRL